MSYSVDHFWLSDLTAFNQIEGTEDEGFPFLPLEQNLGPYLNYDFPNPTLPARHPRGLCEFTGSLLLLTLFVAPVLQGPGAQAFTLPTVARPAAQQPQLLPAPLGLLTTTGTKPFLQTDWPNPVLRVPPALTWVSPATTTIPSIRRPAAFTRTVAKPAAQQPQVLPGPFGLLTTTGEKPFLQTAWPNPVLRVPPALTWLHQRPTDLILLARSPQSTRIQFAAAQQPGQAVNLLPLRGQQAPFEQTNWPNPRGPVFPIDLLTWIQPPPPAEVVPFEPVDWPNPSGPVFQVGLRTWTSSLPMPFEGGEKPFLQSEWPNPVLRVGALPPALNNLLPLGATAQAPFFNLDFPTPGRLGQPALTWISTLPPPFDGGAKPFLQSAWPNPVLATPAALTWINEITASVDAPFSQASWPNPVRALPAALTWTSTLPPPFDGGAKPFLQSDWPNPLGAYTWRAIEPSQSFLANAFQILPPGKAALPDRAAAPRVVSADVQNVLGLLTQPAPFVAPNLPNPRGYEFPIALRTWVALPVPVPPTQPPFLNFDQPNPRGARPVPLSYTLGAPLPFDGGAKPIGQAGAEPPVVRAAAAPRTDPPNLLTTTLAPAANPFNQAQWPNPTAVTPASQRLHVGAPLPFDGGAKPFLQVAWPNPIRALPAALTWVNTFPPPFAGGDKPFLQSDWSNPRAPVPRALGLDVLNVLALLSPDKPFTAPLLPNPRGAEFPVALRSWSAKPPPTPDPQTPFLNYDFPNPRGAKPIPLTFAVGAPLPFDGGEKPVGLTAVSLPSPRTPDPAPAQALNLLGTTLGFVGNPFEQVDWPNPRGPLYLTFAPGANRILPLTHVPFRQSQWPNPVLARVTIPRETQQDAFTAENLLRTFRPILIENPRGPRRSKSLLTWVNNFPMPFDGGEKPFAQNSWPVPPGAVSGDTKFTLATSLSLITAPIFDPFFQTSWPNPLPTLWTIYGSTDRIKLPLIVPAEIPRITSYWQWPNPRGAAWTIHGHINYKTERPPFRQLNWPNPVLRTPAALTWRSIQPVPFNGGAKPFKQTDWPNPVLATPPAKTWTGTLPIPFEAGAKPFKQTEFPNPVLRVRPALTFLRLAPMPFEVGLQPGRQTQWTVPRGYEYSVGLRKWANFVILPSTYSVPSEQNAHVLDRRVSVYVQDFVPKAASLVRVSIAYNNDVRRSLYVMTEEDLAALGSPVSLPTRGG